MTYKSSQPTSNIKMKHTVTESEINNLIESLDKPTDPSHARDSFETLTRWLKDPFLHLSPELRDRIKTALSQYETSCGENQREIRMDEIVLKLNTPEKCEVFARNCTERGREDLALQAQQRAIQLRAAAYGATSKAEREALEAIYAYEEVLREKNGKKTRAQRTWNMIKDHGIIGTIERAVNRPTETQGYTALVQMGLKNYAFEAVVVRHPHLFSEETVRVSKERIARHESDSIN